MGHRDIFADNVSEAIDTVVLNATNGFSKIPEYQHNDFANAVIQNFISEYVMHHLNNGASQQWGTAVLQTTLNCLYSLQESHSEITPLFTSLNNQFKK